MHLSGKFPLQKKSMIRQQKWRAFKTQVISATNCIGKMFTTLHMKTAFCKSHPTWTSPPSLYPPAIFQAYKLYYSISQSCFWGWWKNNNNSHPVLQLNGEKYFTAFSHRWKSWISCQEDLRASELQESVQKVWGKTSSENRNNPLSFNLMHVNVCFNCACLYFVNHSGNGKVGYTYF